MTDPRDQEMLDLLGEKTPSDLSSEEIASLQSIMRKSPTVREALAEEVGFEEALSTTMAPPVEDPSGAVDTIAERARSRRRGQLMRFYGVVVVALFLVAAFPTSRYWMPAPGDGPHTLANDPNAADPTGSGLAAAAPPEAATPGTVVGVDEAGDQTGGAVNRTLRPLVPIFEDHYIDPLTTQGFASAEAIQAAFKPLGKAGWDTRHDDGVGIRGTYRLEEPLHADQMLRLSLGESKPTVTLDLWDELEGVRFVWRDRRWTAYAVTRKKTEEINPATSAKLGVDMCRGEMHGTMPFDLSLIDGQAVLSRAGVRLIAAPFAPARAAVHLTSENRLYLAERRAGVAIPHTVPPAHEPLPEAAWHAAESDTPARVKDHDGRSTIEADASTHAPLAELPWPSTPTYDLRFEVALAPAGTMFELKIADGKALSVTAVVAERDGRRVIATGPGRGEIDAAIKASHFIGDRVFLRYVGGLAGVRCMASRDGQSWYTLRSAGYPSDKELGHRLPTALTVRVPESAKPVSLVLGHATGLQYTALASLQQELEGREHETLTAYQGLDDLNDALNAGTRGQAVASAMQELAWRAPAKDLSRVIPALAQVTERAVRRELDAGRIDEAIDIARCPSRSRTPRHAATPGCLASRPGRPSACSGMGSTTPASGMRWAKRSSRPTPRRSAQTAGRLTRTAAPKRSPA